jgi:DHA2 family multidrug resistance protein
MSSAGAPAALPPMTGTALAVTSIALALGTFMQVLDTSVANVALPTIAGNLGVSTDQATWVITSFSVANGVAVPLTGWLMGRFGVVRVFVFSVLLFTAASFLCGAAWSLNSLVGFRLLQGAVSGPLMPGSQALLISIFPARSRSAALGIWSITTLVAPVLGPILGGYISDNYDWGWIFFINVPVGLLCGYVCWHNLAKRETQTRKLPIDVMGVMLLVIWVGALQVMLDTGKDADWFSSPQIVLLGLTALIGCAVFVVWELSERYPVVDLSLLGKRNFAFGTISFCLGYAVFFGNIVLLPLWLQTQLGYTATWAGLVSAPSGVVAVVLTPLFARFMGNMDARIGATIAFVAFAISYFMRAGLTADASFGDFVMPLLVQGIAMSVFFVAMINISLDGIEPARIPSASGISNFARITAGGFAASVTTTFWDRREALHQTRLVETFTAFNPQMRQALAQLHALGIPVTQSYALLLRNLVNQAYLLAADDLFWISGWASVAMLGLVWLARRSIPGGTVHAAAD